VSNERCCRTLRGGDRPRLDGNGHGARASTRAGFDVVGCDANPATVEQFVREGGRGAPDPASAAAGVDIVICVVVNAAQTEAVLFGENGAAPSMPEGAVFISSATMDPAEPAGGLRRG
jgi:L-threonate 2-dehydrogenase